MTTYIHTHLILTIATSTAFSVEYDRSHNIIKVLSLETVLVAGKYRISEQIFSVVVPC